jgi:hypothetical protein
MSEQWGWYCFMLLFEISHDATFGHRAGGSKG